MKLLFLTTYNVSVNKEHVFTKNVWKYLCLYYSPAELVLGSCFVDERRENSYIEETVTEQGFLYYQLFTSPMGVEKDIKNFFSYISPTIIHSNMIESIDVLAAKSLNIPIILTIHIGGIICPRGGVNGFLMYNDHICTHKVSKDCSKCMIKDFPFPWLSTILYNIFPDFIKNYFAKKIQKQYFYITPFLRINQVIDGVLKHIEIFKTATLIAPNNQLISILNRNGLYKVKLLSHGIPSRNKLPFPKIDGIIRFYYLGRIQYSKGIHNMIKAFEGIDKNSYELHIIGEAGKHKNSRRYYSRVKSLARNKNVIFHGAIPNDEIDSLIKDYHVMIHPTICLEVYGISISESLSMGRPVLATRCGGAEMQVKGNYNGWLVTPNDVEEMKTKIKEIISHPDTIYKYAENSSNPNPVERYVSQLDNLYRECCSLTHE